MKFKTILTFALMAVCCNYTFAQSPLLRRPTPTRQRSEHSELHSTEQSPLISGVTGPLIPFEEKDKIKYEDAVERAKKNDAEAFYWLAYYFLKGEGVTKDSNAAGKFLQKAVDAGNAKACYLTGLYHEFYSLKDERGQSLPWGNLLTEKESAEMWNVLERAKLDHGSFSLQMPKADGSDDSQAHGFLRRPGFSSRGGNTINCCCTNDIAVAYVIGLYSTAVKSGLTYATNDIARLKRAIAKCRERIAVETEARAKSAAALDLLSATSAKEYEVAKQKEDEERRRLYEEKERERKYWATWPRTLGDEERTLLDSDFEKKFNCAFGETGTNTWMIGCGKALVIAHGDGFFQKIDSNGLIVAHGLYENRRDLEEYKWYENEKDKRLKAKRIKWAGERGMSLDEATQKYNAWQEQNRRLLRPPPNRLLNLSRPGLNRPSSTATNPNNRPLSGLKIARARHDERLKQQQTETEQRRQAAEQAKKEREQEKKERELAAEERRAQLEQLMQIQEELRRQREERLLEEKLRKNNNKK